MYKAKVIENLHNNTYKINIPSLGVAEQLAYALVSISNLSKGDLVIVGRLNDSNWVILGQVLEAN